MGRDSVVRAWVYLAWPLLFASGAQAGVITSYDPNSRLQHFAVECGKAMRVVKTWARPKVNHVRGHVRARVDHAVGVALDGFLSERMSQNLEALLQSREGEAPEVGGASALLNHALRALEPAYARDFRIVFRDLELTLFVEHEATPSVFPPRTPLWVHRYDPLVYGRVSDEMLHRLYRYARDHAP